MQQQVESTHTWGQKAAYIRRNLPMVERVFKILKLIVISPHDSIKSQSWEGFEKITFSKTIDFDQPYKNALFYNGKMRFSQNPPKIDTLYYHGVK